MLIILCFSLLLELPDFIEPIQNISVPSGREAVLQCSVRNLGDYRVSLNCHSVFTKNFLVIFRATF